VREIEVTEINRPGLELAGFFENFAWQRIQIFGQGESAFLARTAGDGRLSNLERLFTYRIPCCVFTHALKPTDDFAALAEKAECPVLQTPLSSSEFTMRILRVLSTIFAPRQSVHGTLVEVFGIGVLIQGDSGVGKSETALALIERSHRLVADDVVEIRRVSGNILLGAGAKVVSYHMEIRGLGIINIAHLYGVGAIRDRKQVQLVCQLENWDPQKNYDRIGAEENTIEILGVHVPLVVIPIKPGRNIPVIIETAARNERLKKMGYNSAKEFNRNIQAWLETESTRAMFGTEK
jgi:HPr kinase/phosphorylase